MDNTSSIHSSLTYVLTLRYNPIGCLDPTRMSRQSRYGLPIVVRLLLRIELLIEIGNGLAHA